MLGNLRLKKKLTIIGLLLSILPLLLVSTLAIIQNNEILNIASEESERLAHADLEHITSGIYSMCKSQQDLLQKTIDNSMKVAVSVVTSHGEISFNDETEQWEAVNQYSKSVSAVSLPQMTIGGTPVIKNFDMNQDSFIVDKIKELVGATCTIFQRMNDNGDMLRISTNVEKLDGNRAIGTYIPAVNPDGKSNPVIKNILEGKPFTGRAYVVNDWYITAYKPLYDGSSKITGMLYVGIPQESVTSLRNAVMNTKVGETGYVYVLDSSGKYIISKDGARDGEDISGLKDADGNLFIKEMCDKTVALKPGEISQFEYKWKNPGDKAPRNKIVRLMYFEPWDWIIGAGSYDDEFYKSSNMIAGIGNRCFYTCMAIIGICIILPVFIWLWVANGITKPLSKSIERVDAIRSRK